MRSCLDNLVTKILKDDVKRGEECQMRVVTFSYLDKVQTGLYESSYTQVKLSSTLTEH